MPTLKQYLAGKNVSRWCKEHGITKESVFQVISGHRKYLGVEVAAQVVRATNGEVELEGLVRPQVAQAVNVLITESGNSDEKSLQK